jgi:type II secretory pathway component PulJ
MTQLTSEMRAAIQIVSRDVRRAGYDSDALAGFLTTQAIASGVTLGDLDESGVAGCVHVTYDDISRGQSGKRANVVYRLRTLSSVGRLSALLGDEDDNFSCETSITHEGWVDLTDALLVDISALQFVRNENLTDIAENLNNGHMIQVGIEQINITITATLRSNETISRSITNRVQIRNQYLRV